MLHALTCEFDVSTEFREAFPTHSCYSSRLFTRLLTLLNFKSLKNFAITLWNSLLLYATLNKKLHEDEDVRSNALTRGNYQLPELFDSQGKGYNLRNADFSIPRVNTVTYGKHSLRYFGPYLWIRLDKKIKSLTSLESFKGNIRKVDLTALVESDCAADCALCT